MAKAFFFTTVIVCFGAIGLLFAQELNLLPAPVYSFLYGIESSVPFFNTSVPPYLQKFEGNWMMTLTPTSAESELGDCSIISGLLHVQKGVFSGSIGPLGSAFVVVASTTEDGALSGTFGGTTVRMGTLTATLQNGEGAGRWSDTYNCSGTVQLEKQDPVIDPVKGRVVSEQGVAELLRGSTSEVLFPGLALYQDDKIVTQDGSVLLGLGSDFGTAVTVPANSTYKVAQ